MSCFAALWNQQGSCFTNQRSFIVLGSIAQNSSKDLLTHFLSCSWDKWKSFPHQSHRGQWGGRGTSGMCTWGMCHFLVSLSACMGRMGQMHHGSTMWSTMWSTLWSTMWNTMWNTRNFSFASRLHQRSLSETTITATAFSFDIRPISSVQGQSCPRCHLRCNKILKQRHYWKLCFRFFSWVLTPAESCWLLRLLQDVPVVLALELLDAIVM